MREMPRRLLRELLDRGLQLSLRNRQANIWLDPYEYHGRTVRIGRVLERSIDVATPPREAFRQDANDGVVFTIQLQGFAKNIGLTRVMSLPVLIAQNRNVRGMQGVPGVFRRKFASHQRRYSKIIKSIRGQMPRRDRLGQISARISHARLVHRNRTVKNSVILKLPELRTG